MGLITAIRRGAAALVGRPVEKVAAVGVPSPGFLPTLGSTPSAASVLVSQGTAISVSAVYACVTIRAQDVARCTPRLFRRNADGTRTQVLDHPVIELFKRPNREQTWFEWMEQMEGAHLLRGNAYAAKKRDGRRRIRELIPLNPDAVLALESSTGEIYYNVNRIGLWQIAMLREFPSSIPEDDILHLRGLTFNSLVGVSTIHIARDAIGVAMGLEQQAARWMANGSRPSVVLQSKKGLTETAAKRLKAAWNEFQAGLMNTGNTVVLEDGVEAKEMALKSVDLEFMAQRNYQLGDAARFWRVPPHKLGLEQMRGVNLVQMDQDYVSNTIMPDLHRWEQKLKVELELDDDLEVDLDETVLLRADITTRYNASRIGLLSGFLAPNEIRAGENLPPVPGGDQVFRPLNMAALGSDMTGTAPDGAGRPASGELPADATDGAAPAGESEKA